MKKVLLILMAILFSTLVFALRETDCGIDDCTGLKAYWKMNVDPAQHNVLLNDYSGNSVTMRLQTSDAINKAVSPVDSNFISAVSFDGSNDQMFTTNSNPLNILGDLTIEAWIKTTDTSGFIFHRVYSFSPYKGYSFKIHSSRLAFSSSYGSLSLSSSTVNDGQWHHVAVVGSGSTGTFYIDGLPSGNFAYSSPVSVSAQTYIGSNTPPFSSDYFSGSLDEVKVWNRGLTESEINYIVNNGYISSDEIEEDIQVPEFTTTGMILIIILVIGSTSITRKKKKMNFSKKV